MEEKDFVPQIDPCDAGVDLPDERDWEYSDIMELKEDEEEEVWGNTQADIEVIRKLLTIFNQWARRETQNACGEYWLRHCDNTQHLFVDGVQVDPLNWWLEYQNQRPARSVGKGTSIQSNLARFKNASIISWYAKAMSINQAKEAIDNRNFIYTGSNNWDWTSVRTKWLYQRRTDWKVVWHLFCVVGYDDDWFIGVNSYWPNNWYFTIPYHLWNTLYTRYAVFGIDEKYLLLTYRAMRTIKEAVQEGVKLGITNGERLKDTLTREEGITMVVRGIDVTTQKVQEIVTDLIQKLNK